MYYVILDSTGNLIESFEDEAAAVAELERIATEDPEAADEIALLTYDEAGHLVGQPVTPDAVAA